MNYLYSEKDHKEFFVQDDVHFSHVLTPLFASFQLPMQERGTQIAFDIMKMPLERFVCRLFRGRFYQYNAPYKGDMKVRAKEHEAALAQRLPVIVDYYQDKVDRILLPYYEKLKRLAKEPLDIEQALPLLQEMHNFYETAWAIHFDIILPRLDVGFMLEDIYKKLTGEADGQFVYELLVGTMNKSLETDKVFWQFANDIKKVAEVCELILNTEASQVEAALSMHPKGEIFVQKMRTCLEIYGYRTSFSHEFVNETWVENSKYAWDLVRTYLQKEYDFDREFNELVHRREVAFASFLEHVPDSPLRQEFLRLYEIGLHCWGMDEDHHFYIDTMLPATYRPVLLQIAKVLVEHGVIDEPSDIFFLYYEEVCAVLQKPQNHMETVRTRKMEYNQYVAEEGYPHLGPEPEPAEDEDLLVDRLFGLPKFLQENTNTFVKGYAASRGIHTGVVKIVRDQDEFPKVEPGDVLVCKTTTPPWTVLFSVAGAIVTDAGGILSHAGTVAREYKIPAVLGTKVATKTLKDGDVVMVNGTEGTVVVVPA